jgi:hypothetical protein
MPHPLCRLPHPLCERGELAVGPPSAGRTGTERPVPRRPRPSLRSRPVGHDVVNFLFSLAVLLGFARLLGGGRVAASPTAPLQRQLLDDQKKTNRHGVTDDPPPPTPDRVAWVIRDPPLPLRTPSFPFSPPARPGCSYLSRPVPSPASLPRRPLVRCRPRQARLCSRPSSPCGPPSTLRSSIRLTLLRPNIG